VGGLPEVVRDGRTGVLAPEVNADSVAEAILRFLELTKQVDWSVEIEEFRKLMSWDRFVDALEELVGGKG
jgi:glycosyltransferase involved in cell wall biosynthesis